MLGYIANKALLLLSYFGSDNSLTPVVPGVIFDMLLLLTSIFFIIYFSKNISNPGLLNNMKHVLIRRPLCFIRAVYESHSDRLP